MTETETEGVDVRRLGVTDRDVASATFELMAQTFEERRASLSDAYTDRLLNQPDFWVFAAIVHDRPVGGLTAHVLPMTAFEGAEVFLYDIAVARDCQRRGVGRRLLDALRREAISHGISTVFVAADADDIDACAFYSALGGVASEVTLFEFTSS